MISLTALILLALAAYRVTRLIVIDAIFDEPRAWLIRKLGFKKSRKDGDLYNREHPIFEKLIYLMTCTWCVGVWVSAFLFIALYREFKFVDIFAIAGLQGLLHALEPSDD
jgi:hypothetical protein